MVDDKIGWTELGLEDISYGQGDIRVHLTPEALKINYTFLLVLNTDNILFMGLTLWSWIPLGIKDNGGTFAEDAFGIDDNKWFDLHMENPDTSTGWDSQQLYEDRSCNR